MLPLFITTFISTDAQQWTEADDQVITSKTESRAKQLRSLTQNLFQIIGLEVSPNKSIGIRIKDGKLNTGTIAINETAIKCIHDGDKIKYLDHAFHYEMSFDNKIVKEMIEGMNSLIKTPLLK